MRLEKSWQEALQETISNEKITKLKQFLEEEKKRGQVIFPLEKDIFNAFLQTPLDQVKVVIIGQDPYHGEGQAHGLSFSVQEGVKLPPSLKNIFKELESDLGIKAGATGNLLPWAKQGVLLLNAILTVEKNQPLSHHNQGWEYFTDAVVEKLIERKDPIIFALWGQKAQEKVSRFLKDGHHIILTAPHPSPFSAYSGFFGCRHFSKINEHLRALGQEPIEWRLS